jgi:hypothetical protein
LPSGNDLTPSRLFVTVAQKQTDFSMAKSFLPLLFLTLANIGFAESDVDSACCTTARSIQLEARHTEPRGVGYYEGYTTLEAFLIPAEPLSDFYPYLDSRTHIFNSGRKAFNTGIGARYECGGRIYGGNIYYDYRSSPEKNFNQIAFGLETLGVRWDIYLNGYAVVGDRKSRVYDAQFASFSGNRMFVKQKVHSALSGFDAKVRCHALKRAHYDLFFDLSPYYYTGPHAKNVVGVKAAVGGRITDYLFVEANTSYDREYKWLGQGIIGVTYPFGNRNKKKVSGCDCNTAMVMRDRMVQMPSRQEIIPVKTKKVISTAIDPSTGQPYFFVFVNNLSHSAGTFESPYPTLAEAEAPNSRPGDMIYVFPGDGTTNGMTAGITLQDRQQLLGSGTVQSVNTTLGQISIPALTTTIPKITNTLTTNNGVVIAANDNTISGFHFEGSHKSGIYVDGKSSTNILNNRFTNTDASDSGDQGAIYLVGPNLSGTYLIRNNTIIQAASETSASGIFFKPQATDVLKVLITDNLISVKKHGFDHDSSGANDLSVTDLVISNNNITSSTSSAINIQPHQESRLNLWVLSNTISAPDDVGMTISGRDTSITTAFISSNLFTGCRKSAFKYESGGSNPGSMTATISHNTFANNLFGPLGINDHGDFYSKHSAGDSQAVYGTLNNNYAPENGYYIDNQGGGVFDIQFGSGNIGPITLVP